MSLHEEYDDFEEHSFSDYNFDEEFDDLPHRKRIRRMLEERLERKRIKGEFRDEFDEHDADFDWDEIDR